MPPEEAAEVPATPAAAPPPAPAAESPSSSPESFYRAMERLGGFDNAPEAPEPAAAPAPAAEAPAVSAEPEKPEPKPEKPTKGKRGTKGKEPEKPAEAAPAAAEVVATTPEQKTETLRALAKDLGMVIEDGKVVTSDRAALRVAKREHEQRIKAAEADLHARYNQAIEAVKPELERARAVIQAMEDGDADELAKLAGAKDWNEFQERALAKITDPNWKKIRDLERKQAERDRADAEHQERLKAQSEQNRQLEAQRTFRTQLAGQMKKSADPLCREMADDPAFVHAIFQIQKENWDGSTTVTPEQALKLMVRGAPLSVQDELKQTYERLHKVFGQATTMPAAIAAPAAAPVSTDKPGARPRPKTGVAPAATGGAPSPIAEFKTKAERHAYTQRRLAEAAEADRRNAS